jgi:hypothetical protein
VCRLGRLIFPFSLRKSNPAKQMGSMNCFHRWAIVAALAAALGGAGPASGQSASGRQFAPGVLTIIAPAPEARDMFTGPLPLVEVPIAMEGIAYEPKLSSKSSTVLERSKTVTLRRAVWNLEFSFKPLRMIYVDIPQGTGRMQRQLVYYLVYRVRNLGNHFQPQASSADIANLVTSAVPPPPELYEKYKTLTQEVEVFGRKTTELRFFPHISLASIEYDKEYLDRVIPAALAPIRAREFPGRADVKLHNSLTISEVPIAISDDQHDHSAWGVATWAEVDPRIDYFVVHVQGLTNAYQLADPAGAYKKGDAPGTGRKLLKKTLQLNFWRPGDTVDPHEEEIRYGARLDPDPVEQRKILEKYGVDKPIDHIWVYR